MSNTPAARVALSATNVRALMNVLLQYRYLIDLIVYLSLLNSILLWYPSLSHCRGQPTITTSRMPWFLIIHFPHGRCSAYDPLPPSAFLFSIRRASSLADRLWWVAAFAGRGDQGLRRAWQLQLVRCQVMAPVLDNISKNSLYPVSKISKFWNYRTWTCHNERALD